MEVVLVARAALSCGVIALVLIGLRHCLRTCSRHAPFRGLRPQLVAVLETTFLPSAASLHVIRIGPSYALVGCSHGQVAMLADIPPAVVEAWRTQAPHPALPAAWERLLRRARRARA